MTTITLSVPGVADAYPYTVLPYEIAVTRNTYYSPIDAAHEHNRTAVMWNVAAKIIFAVPAVLLGVGIFAIVCTSISSTGLSLIGMSLVVSLATGVWLSNRCNGNADRERQLAEFEKKVNNTLENLRGNRESFIQFCRGNLLVADEQSIIPFYARYISLQQHREMESLAGRLFTEITTSFGRPHARGHERLVENSAGRQF
jgi:hypothetical protein